MPRMPRKVYQCSLDGKVLRIFASASEAATFLGSPSPHAIYSSLRTGKPALGYLWRYEGSISFQQSQFPVLVTKESEGYRKVFRSIDQAHRVLHLPTSIIRKHLYEGTEYQGYRFVKLKK